MQVGHRAFLQFPDVVLCNRRSHAQAGRSGFDPFFPDRPETCQRPASCGKVLEQSAGAELAASRAAVVGGLPEGSKGPAGGLRCKAPLALVVVTCETWRYQKPKAEGAALQSHLVRAIAPYARCHRACVVLTPSTGMLAKNI